ncbi:hypothetical protein Tco_1365904, partial [Tanacetum coccineum]
MDTAYGAVDTPYWEYWSNAALTCNSLGDEYTVSLVLRYEPVLL